MFQLHLLSWRKKFLLRPGCKLARPLKVAGGSLCLVKRVQEGGGQIGNDSAEYKNLARSRIWYHLLPNLLGLLRQLLPTFSVCPSAHSLFSLPPLSGPLAFHLEQSASTLERFPPAGLF